MKLKTYGKAEEFWRVAGPFLLANEAENNLMISIVRSLLDDPTRYEKPYFATGVDGDGNIRAVALMTPPHNLLLGRCDESFMTLVLRDLCEHIDNVRGVTGPNDLPRRFCDLAAAEAGLEAELAMSLRTFKLTHVADLPPLPGRFALAQPGDRLVVASMIGGFVSDAHIDVHDEAQKQADELIAAELLYVWRDDADAVVSMAGLASGDTPRGQRIGWVYTPPELRGRGYASSVVASLSRHILDRGKTFCFLFTDLSNPTSNKIYRRIGYEPICDFNDYRFRKETNVRCT
jgi:predicted GNAT family acetyltransferase